MNRAARLASDEFAAAEAALAVRCVTTAQAELLEKLQVRSLLAPREGEPRRNDGTVLFPPVAFFFTRSFRSEYKAAARRVRDAALLEARCRAAVSGEAEAPLNDAQLNAIADGSATLGEGVASDAARRANLARLWHDNRHELQRTIEETRPGGLLPVDAAASMAHLRQHAGLAARGAEAHRAEAEGAPAEPTAATVAAQQLAAGKAFMLDALYTRLLGIWYDALVMWTRARLKSSPSPPSPASPLAAAPTTLAAAPTTRLRRLSSERRPPRQSPLSPPQDPPTPPTASPPSPLIRR